MPTTIFSRNLRVRLLPTLSHSITMQAIARRIGSHLDDTFRLNDLDVNLDVTICVFKYKR